MKMHSIEPTKEEIDYCVAWLKRHKIATFYQPTVKEWFIFEDYDLRDYCDYCYKLYRRLRKYSRTDYLEINYFRAVQIYSETSKYAMKD